MPAGADVVRHARRLTGYTYRFGGELDPLGPPGDCDCSELVEWAVAQAGQEDNTGVRITDGSWLQYEACQRIPLADALGITGALVFLSKTDPPQQGRDGIYHVGVVDAQACEIVEACCSDGHTIRPSPYGARAWYHTAGLIPHITYPEVDVSAADVWNYPFTDYTGKGDTLSAATTLAQARYDADRAVVLAQTTQDQIAVILARLDALETGSSGPHSHQVGPPVPTAR